MSELIPLDIAVTRLALAAFFGAIIGIEREWRNKNAGLKTNTLVAIGAGVILHRGPTVQGVTTAATL